MRWDSYYWHILVGEKWLKYKHSFGAFKAHDLVKRSSRMSRIIRKKLIAWDTNWLLVIWINSWISNWKPLLIHNVCLCTGENRAIYRNSIASTASMSLSWNVKCTRLKIFHTTEWRIMTTKKGFVLSLGL